MRYLENVCCVRQVINPHVSIQDHHAQQCINANMSGLGLGVAGCTTAAMCARLVRGTTVRFGPSMPAWHASTVYALCLMLHPLLHLDGTATHRTHVTLCAGIQVTGQADRQAHDAHLRSTRHIRQVYQPQGAHASMHTGGPATHKHVKTCMNRVVKILCSWTMAAPSEVWEGAQVL